MMRFHANALPLLPGLYCMGLTELTIGQLWTSAVAAEAIELRPQNHIDPESAADSQEWFPLIACSSQS